MHRRREDNDFAVSAADADAPAPGQRRLMRVPSRGSSLALPPLPKASEAPRRHAAPHAAGGTPGGNGATVPQPNGNTHGQAQSVAAAAMAPGTVPLGGVQMAQAPADGAESAASAAPAQPESVTLGGVEVAEAPAEWLRFAGRWGTLGGGTPSPATQRWFLQVCEGSAAAQIRPPCTLLQSWKLLRRRHAPSPPLSRWFLQARAHVTETCLWNLRSGVVRRRDTQPGDPALHGVIAHKVNSCTSHTRLLHAQPRPAALVRADTCRQITNLRAMFNHATQRWILRPPLIQTCVTKTAMWWPHPILDCVSNVQAGASPTLHLRHAIQEATRAAWLVYCCLKDRPFKLSTCLEALTGSCRRSRR